MFNIKNIFINDNNTFRSDIYENQKKSHLYKVDYCLRINCENYVY